MRMTHGPVWPILRVQMPSPRDRLMESSKALSPFGRSEFVATKCIFDGSVSKCSVHNSSNTARKTVNVQRLCDYLA